MRTVVLGLDPVERSALMDLFRDELARGWIPKSTDIEAALAAIRAGQSSQWWTV